MNFIKLNQISQYLKFDLKLNRIYGHQNKSPASFRFKKYNIMLNFVDISQTILYN